MRAWHAGVAAESVRAARIDAAERVAALARERAVDFMVLCGDTFEDNQVDRALVERVVEVLATARCPVFVVTGNHDPLVPGSVWEHERWTRSPGVRVLREEAPLELMCGVTLWPCVARMRHDERDPTLWAKAPRDGRAHVMLAHGTVESVHYDEPYYPIARDAAERAAMDYVALGHFHGFSGYASADGAVRMAYCGTHEPTRFSERDPGQALVVTVGSQGSPPEIERVVTGSLRWIELEEEIRAAGDLARVSERVEAMEHKDRTLLRLKLRGVLLADARAGLEALRERVGEGFLSGRVESALRMAPTDGTWTRGLPPGPVREAAERLARWADGATDDRPEGVTADLAANALAELYALASKGG
jgi:DNA repair exonuclease SbcCD nuclease subunit